jgi:hypothetical protein
MNRSTQTGPRASLPISLAHLPFKLPSRIEFSPQVRRLAMDLNYLFLRQQVERSLAQAAQSRAARDAHDELARCYELAIERKSGGRIVFPWHRQEVAADPGSDQLISAIQTPSASF